MAIFDAGALERQETQVNVDGDTEYGGDAIHGIAHAPGTCSACQHKHAGAADNGRLIGERRIDGKFIARRHDLVPVSFHMKRAGTNAVVHGGSRKQRVKARRLWGFRRFALNLISLFIDQIKGIKRRWLATVDQLLVLIIKVVELIEHVLFDRALARIVHIDAPFLPTNPHPRQQRLKET